MSSYKSQAYSSGWWFARQRARQRRRKDIGFRVQVSNLNLDITAVEVGEIFGMVGPLMGTVTMKRNWSKGEAIVAYRKKHDAHDAIRHYDLCTLDKRAMRVRLISS